MGMLFCGFVRFVITFSLNRIVVSLELLLTSFRNIRKHTNEPLYVHHVGVRTHWLIHHVDSQESDVLFFLI